MKSDKSACMEFLPAYQSKIDENDWKTTKEHANTFPRPFPTSKAY